MIQSDVSLYVILNCIMGKGKEQRKRKESPPLYLHILSERILILMCHIWMRFFQKHTWRIYSENVNNLIIRCYNEFITLNMYVRTDL